MGQNNMGCVIYLYSCKTTHKRMVPNASGSLLGAEEPVFEITLSFLASSSFSRQRENDFLLLRFTIDHMKEVHKLFDVSVQLSYLGLVSKAKSLNLAFTRPLLAKSSQLQWNSSKIQQTQFDMLTLWYIHNSESIFMLQIPLL